jgi:class 3 adenylate cyclase
MAELRTRDRSRLPDSAFAYIDAKGRRRLPIHDRAHVRNALARFDQTLFEDEAARDRARIRLLKAAQKHGIVPVGFMTGQLRPQRRLPTGSVTFLLTDVEASTALVTRLGDHYPTLLADLRRLQRRIVRRHGGREVDTRGDEFFAVFADARDALAAVLALQRHVPDHAWPDGSQVRVRAGLHSGKPTLTDTGYVGLAVHVAARICSAAHGGQIVLSRAAARAIGEAMPDGIGLRSLGEHQLHGLPQREELFQVLGADLAADFPPPRHTVT